MSESYDSGKYTFQMEVDRQTLEKMSDQEILDFFQNEGATTLLQVYKLAHASLNPNPDLTPKAKFTCEASYDTETGGWKVSCGAEGGGKK
jgi:hypothetical protein